MKKTVVPVPTWTWIDRPSISFMSRVCAARTSSADSNSMVAVADDPSDSGTRVRLLILPHCHIIS